MLAPGQHVICVDARPPGGRLDPKFPLVAGRLYTVASVGLCHVAVTDAPMVLFYSTRFRPLSPWSISIVESLMAPVNAPGKVTEPA